MWRQSIVYDQVIKCDRKQAYKDATMSDPKLITVRTIVEKGWPDHKNQEAVGMWEMR